MSAEQWGSTPVDDGLDVLGRPKRPLELDQMKSFRLSAAQRRELDRMVREYRAEHPEERAGAGEVIRLMVFGTTGAGVCRSGDAQEREV